jgi:hypothetical protein
MADDGPEFVDVPETPTIKWGGWDSTVPLPQRRVRLPIAFSLSWRVDLAPALVLLAMSVIAGAFYGLYFVTNGYFEKGECYLKPSHYATSGTWCRTNIGLIGLLCVAIAIFFIIRTFDAAQYWLNVSDKNRPALSFDSNKFMHVQLNAPIQLHEILGVQKFFAKGYLTEVVLTLTIEPDLAFNTFDNRRHGGKRKFTISPSLIAACDQSGARDLVDALTILASLAARARASPQSDPPTSSTAQR